MSTTRAVRGHGRKKSVRAAALGSAAILLASSQMAMAQSTGIETVVVTAQKRSEDIAKVPLTVQAISGDALQREGIRDIKSALALVPGAAISGETSQGTQVYQLRGIATGDVNGDATVASYIDDFAFSIPGLPFAAPADLFDLQRVEVLQGPQGTLYGSNSLGGVIKVVTNEPDLQNFDVRAAASGATVADHGFDYSTDLMVNIPLITDELSVRGVLSVKHLTGDATVPALGIQNGNNDTTFTGRVKVLWTPNDKFSFEGSFWRFDDQQDFTNRVDHVYPVEIADIGVGNSPTSFTLYTGKATYDFGWATVTSTSGYIDRHNSLRALGQQVDTTFDAFIPQRSTSFVQEVRFASDGDGPLHWIGGFFYQYGTVFTDTFFKLTSLFTDGTSLQKSSQYAGFGEISYDLWGGMVKPLIGIRYSAVTQTLGQDSTTTIQNPPPAPPTVLTSTDTVRGRNYHVNPRFNVSVFPNDDGMLFVNVAQGFRPGALQTGAEVASLQAITGVVTTEQLKTDSLWSYEIGGKWSFFDHDLNTSLSLYKIDWAQAQFQTGISGISGIINLGNVHGYGLDAQINYRTPIPGLDLQIAGGWNSTKIYDINPQITTALPFLKNGAQVPPVPEGNLSLVLNYMHPLNYHGLTLISDASWQFRARQTDLSTGRESAVINVFNAEVGVEKDRYQAMFFVDNISNTQGPLIWEEGRMLVPRPRTIGIRLAFNPEL